MPSSSESYLFSLVDAIQSREAKLGLSALGPKEQVFFLVWGLEAEVNNGGFHQFFFNSAGDHAVASAEALRSIGATKMAALADSANAIFDPKGPSKDRDERQTQLESLTESQEEELSRLDDAFYEYPENLSELLTAYMKINEA